MHIVQDYYHYYYMFLADGSAVAIMLLIAWSHSDDDGSGELPANWRLFSLWSLTPASLGLSRDLFFARRPSLGSNGSQDDGTGHRRNRRVPIREAVCKVK